MGLNAKNQPIWLGGPHCTTVSIPLELYRSFFREVGWGYIP
jgi:hypothetical protein